MIASNEGGDVPNGDQIVGGGFVVLSPGELRDTDVRRVAVDSAQAAQRAGLETLLDTVERRLPQIPRYRQKVRFVPGRLARPVWVDDEDFDITYHVRRSALPKPGTDIELDELVGRLISRPLDRTRPLWEVYVIEGLTGGRIALVNKTHHAMVDRMGAVDVAAAILDVNRRSRDLPEQPWIPNPSPSDIDLVVDAVADLTSRPTEVFRIARHAAEDVGAVVSKVLSAAGSAFEVLRRTVSAAPRSSR